MVAEPSHDAEVIAGKVFATSFRGFDQYEVRAFLAQVAAEVTKLREREHDLAQRLAAFEGRDQRRFTEEEMEVALGVETTKVLHAAREAAAEIRSRAEEHVARLLREAQDEAARLHGEAEGVLATRMAEASMAATAAIDEAQQRGREMVNEAQAVRDRMLKDLTRRRRHGEAQVQSLGAARDRLLEALSGVRGTVDQAAVELAAIDVELPAAAEPERTPTPAPSPPIAAEPARDPEPVPERTEPEPERAEPSPVDGRRSSSLRLVRPAEVAVLADDDEGVRIIRADVTPTPAPVAAHPPPAAVEPPGPEGEPEREPEREPEPPVARESAPAREETPEPADTEAEPVPVDDLFARLRADRAAAVARAEEVLAAAPPAVASDDEQPDEPVEEALPGTEGESESVDLAIDDALFERRDAAIEDAERALTRAVKRALADEQNEVLDALRRLRGAPTLASILPVESEHRERFQRLAVDHLASGARAGALQCGGEPPEVGELAATFADDVVADVRRRVERALDAGSGDDEMISQTISSAYREWKTSKAESVSRHHLAAAYASGAFAAVPVGELRWVVDHGEGGCPDCDDNALAGPTPKGRAFPTGQLHPPAHVGCRCLLAPAATAAQ